MHYKDFSINLDGRKTVNYSIITILSDAFKHVAKYLTPATLTYSWTFGSLLGFYFILQIITGLWLTSYYISSVDEAFNSVVRITQQVKYGSFVRYMHSNGATMLFILLYLHIARGLYMRSFSYKRKSAWLTGLIMFLLFMITAFMGYVLPWGQMSFWGVTVITSFLTVVPYIGNDIQEWLIGGFGICPTTLSRFYGLHVVLPFIILIILFFHIFLLHKAGSTPGTQDPDPEGIGFYPYFSVKDIYGLSTSFILYGYLIFFAPNRFGHPDNYIPADSLVTPPHIVPEWYFTPFYAILRAFPDKTFGIVAMLFAIIILALLPFLNYWTATALVLINNNLQKPILMEMNYFVYKFQTAIVILHKICFWSFFIVFGCLIYIGSSAAESPYVLAGQICTFLYFFYFMIVIPLLPYIDFICVHYKILNILPEAKEKK